MNNNIELYKEKNALGEYMYNIDKIISQCDEIYSEKTKFVNLLSHILQEKQKGFIYQLYKKCKKDFLFKMIEKTLDTMNNGGINKQDSENKRTICGTFIYYVKTSNYFTSDELKQVFFRNNQKRKERKKLYKKFNAFCIE
jgi:hypothetical protein